VACVGCALPTGELVPTHEPPLGKASKRAKKFDSSTIVQLEGNENTGVVQLELLYAAIVPPQLAPVTGPHVHAVQSRESLSAPYAMRLTE
jgi:hypothetical protein